jgi:hypothetical protein
MVRTALLALALAFGGGLGGVRDVVTGWAVGSIWDPFGGSEAATSDTNGSDAENDAGAIWDPFG